MVRHRIRHIFIPKQCIQVCTIRLSLLRERERPLQQGLSTARPVQLLRFLPMCSNPPNVYQNAMQSNTDYALVPSSQLDQGWPALSERRWAVFDATNRASAAFDAANPPHVYRNGMQSNTDCAPVLLPQQGWSAPSARPWSGQEAFDAACPTDHPFFVEREREIYRRHLSGENEHNLASEYGVQPYLLYK